MNKSDSDSPQNNETINTFRSYRDIIEALGIALILAFLFKAFIIELYCIPTGSMAATLMGRHKDVNCEVCGFPFQLGASQESNEGSEQPRHPDQLPSVIGGTCPRCQYTMYVGNDNIAGQTYMSFSGDRIFVNKSLFNYREPSRWHVTVFRYPAKPQINYIKRLVGLENETVMIRNGQIFAQKDGSDHFEIQRKPLRQLLSMLRPVDDNDYVVPAIHELGWKTRWYSDDERWQRSEDYKSFTGTSKPDEREISWLKFRYITATTADWHYLIQGLLPEHNPTGVPQLITDALAYNSPMLYYPPPPPPGAKPPSNLQVFFNSFLNWFRTVPTPSPPPRDSATMLESPLLHNPAKNVLMGQRVPEGFGLNWVGDLAMRCTITFEEKWGVASLRLVKGGINFQCDLEPSFGLVTISIPDVPEFQRLSIPAPIRLGDSPNGRKFDVMFCNIDEEMRLIINGKEIDFDKWGRYDALCCNGGKQCRDSVQCYYANPLCRDRRPTVLDLEPASIGIQGTSVKVENLKIMRNMYYISCDETTRGSNCDLIRSPFQYGFSFEEDIRRILSTPALWRDFGKTRQTIFKLDKDQFLMCGDNSAQSKDSRLWTEDKIPHYVDRQYLIGEAIYVFWPHGHRIPGTRLALIPNFSKMRWID
jgi:signal peptidase I